MRKTRNSFITSIIGMILLYSCTENQSKEMEVHTKFIPREQAVRQLDSLKTIIKFSPTENYTGLQPTNNISKANSVLNKSIDRLLLILENKPTIQNILREYENGLSTFNTLAIDTEDREKVCYYYDEIREIIGFDSTDNILNDWLY